jgi:outer membrane protein
MKRSVVVALMLVARTAAADEPAPLALSIEQALGRVDGATETLAAAHEELARVRGQIDVIKSARLPQANANASYQRLISSEYGGLSIGPFGQANSWRVGLSVTQSLYDGGRTRAALTSARNGIRTGTLAITSQRTAVVFEVAQAYWDAALAVREVEIGGVALASAEETLAQMQLAFANQSAAEFDVVRSEVTRDNQRTALIQLNAQREVAMLQLARLVGADLSQPIELTSRLEIDDDASIAAAAKDAAQLAPNQAAIVIEQAELAVSTEEAALAAIKADRMPQINASTDIGIVDYPSGFLPFNTDWRLNWTVGVAMSVSLFDGFRHRSNIANARRAVVAAKARLVDVKERAAVSARSSTAALSAASATWQASQRTVTQAERAYQIAELRFAQGASTHLELVDARLQVQQAQHNRARSARDVRVAKLRIELLAGLTASTGASR